MLKAERLRMIVQIVAIYSAGSRDGSTPLKGHSKLLRHKSPPGLDSSTNLHPLTGPFDWY